MKPLFPFSSSPLRCAKCAANAVIMRYRETDQIAREHLACTCGICGFEWAMQCYAGVVLWPAGGDNTPPKRWATLSMSDEGATPVPMLPKRRGRRKK